MSDRVTVVVPVRNDAADLPAAVEALLAQTRLDAISEILLCVGPSDDDTAEVAGQLEARHRPVRVLVNDHGGIPQALNIGLAAASGDRLLRVDARSVLAPDHLRHAIETARDTGAANVGAVQRPVGGSLGQRAIASAMRSPLGSGGAAYRHGGDRRRVDTAFLGFYAVDALRAVGGWDERFARNEDAELHARLAEAGYETWLDPRLVVDYRPRATLASLAEQYFRYGWWRRHTMGRHPGSMAVRQLASPIIVLVLVGSLALGISGIPAAFVVPVGYGAIVLGAGLVSAGSLRQRLLTGAALAVMHLSWGVGFLLSAVRALVPGAQRGST